MPIPPSFADQLSAKHSKSVSEIDADPLLACIRHTDPFIRDFGTIVDQLIDDYVQIKNYPDTDRLYMIGEAWKTRLAQFYPTSITRTLILTAEKKEVSIMPCRYSIQTSGIEDQPNRWRHLMTRIQQDRWIWVIQVDVESAMLFRVGPDKTTCLIQQPIGQQKRHSYIEAFAKAVRLICHDPFIPLIARYTGNEIHELDAIILSRSNNIHQHLINRTNTDMDAWSRESMKCGRIDEWIQSNIELQVKQAEQEDKWTSHGPSIHTQLLQNRITHRVFNECEEELFDVCNESYSLLFKNNVQIIRSERTKSGAILN